MSLRRRYRAKFIVATARQLQACGGRPFLMALRREPRLHVREQLLQFAGVGPKVADCVALFSLEQHDVVPVDTHVWDIACRDFDRTLQVPVCHPSVSALSCPVHRCSLTALKPLLPACLAEGEVADTIGV
jgi:hypothetical protein